jgi:hypothetical protein
MPRGADGVTLQAIDELKMNLLVKACNSVTNAGGKKEVLLGTWNRLALYRLQRNLASSNTNVATVVRTAFEGCLLDVGAGTGELLRTCGDLFKTARVCCFPIVFNCYQHYGMKSAVDSWLAGSQ